MFHGRQINDKINELNERALQIVYNDTITSFEKLLVKDKTFTMHYPNIQSLAIELQKAVNNSPGGNLSRFFVRNNHNYNLCSRSELIVPSINTVFKGQNSISYYGSVIWNKLREKSYQVFKSELKAWRPTNCPCRLCKDYIENLGFVNIASQLVRYICIFTSQQILIILQIRCKQSWFVFYEPCLAFLV